MVTYYLNGTAANTFGFYGAKSPVAAGDRIRFMLQYDRSTPIVYSSSVEGNIYNHKGPLISNIVDLTNGYHVLSLPRTGVYSQIQVLNEYPFGSGIIIQDAGIPSSLSQGLELYSKTPFPTLNLSKLALNDLPLAPNTLGFNAVSTSFEFNADIYSLSTSISSTPEPDSLVLLALGAFGLAFRRFRSWLGLQGESGASPRLPRASDSSLTYSS